MMDNDGGLFIGIVACCNFQAFAVVMIPQLVD